MTDQPELNQQELIRGLRALYADAEKEVQRLREVIQEIHHLVDRSADVLVDGTLPHDIWSITLDALSPKDSPDD